MYSEFSYLLSAQVNQLDKRNCHCLRNRKQVIFFASGGSSIVARTYDSIEAFPVFFLKEPGSTDVRDRHLCSKVVLSQCCLKGNFVAATLKQSYV